MASSGYISWSVTAGEIPTTAYWNILGSNDASFNTGNGFNDGIIIPRHFQAGAVAQANNPYKFSAYRSTGVNTNDGVNYTIVFDTELFDTNTNYNNSTGTYTVPVTGFYLIMARAYISGTTGTGWLWQAALSITQNGSIIDQDSLYVYDQGRFTFYTAKTANLYPLTAGDTINAIAMGDTNSGIQWSLGSGRVATSFSGFLVSA